MTFVRFDQETAQARVIGRLTDDFPTLTDQQALDVLGAARCLSSRSLKLLEGYLDGHPQAFLVSSSHVPLVFVRLAHALHDQGLIDVVLPTCAGCGTPQRQLPSVDESGGRLCKRCGDARRAPEPCARCGQVTRICARRPEGGICGRCYQADPSRHESCASCGRSRLAARRLPDGSALCQSCTPRPLYVCSGCGASSPAHAITSRGPVCETCYRRPERSCGACGRVARIYRRATMDLPDLCGGCYVGVEATCTICGRTRQCRRGRDSGDLACRSCRPIRQRLCGYCDQYGETRAIWPEGPACRHCYQTIRANPASCADCSILRVLIGKNAASEPVCGPCAGVDIDYRCRSCSQPEDLYAEGVCARCVLKERLADLLTGADGVIDQRLDPIHSALQAVPNPRSTLVWLSRCPAARLLIEVATEPDCISHHFLDQSPHVQAAHYLRGLLVHTGILPGRDESIERIGPWADRLLANQPDHAHLIRPFLHWYLLPRARRRVRRRRSTPHSARTPRAQVLAALEFLTWLKAHDLNLDTVGQDDVDRWLTTGPPSRYAVGSFLTWAEKHRLAGQVAVPRRRARGPGLFLDDDRYTNELRRCLSDTQLPLDVRVAGVLVLLFGAALPRIMQLTVDDIDQRGTDTYLNLGNKPAPLPPALAAMTRQLLNEQRDPSAVSCATGPTRWLFPGMIAGRPASPVSFNDKLIRHGITALAGRNSARRALASDLPAAVMADLFDIHIDTAVHWVRQAKTDWTGYLAERTLADTPGRSTRPR